MDFSFVKRHPYATGGAILGLIVLWLLFRSGSNSSSAATVTGSTSPTANDLQLASINAGIQTAQIQEQGAVAATAAQADVANNQTAAQLQANELQTAAQLQLGDEQTQAQLAAQINGQQVNLAEVQDTNATSVQLQTIQSNQAVAQTQTEADAATTIAGTAAQVEEQQTQAQEAVALGQQKLNTDVFNTLSKYSKHFSTDIVAAVPFVAAANGAPAAGAAASSSQRASGSAVTSNTISTGVKGVSSILSGLFS